MDPVTEEIHHKAASDHTVPHQDSLNWSLEMTDNRYRYLHLLASCLVDPQSPELHPFGQQYMMFDRFDRLDHKEIYTYSLRLKTMLF
jgi:hypothetical protein